MLRWCIVYFIDNVVCCKSLKKDNKQICERYAFLLHKYGTYLSKYALNLKKTLKYTLICQFLAKKSIFIPSLVIRLTKNVFKELKLIDKREKNFHKKIF